MIGLGHSDDPRSVLFANPYNYFNYLGEDDVRAASELYGPGSLTAIAPTLPSWSSTGIEDDISAHVIDSERKTVDRISMKGFSWLKPWRSRAIRPKGKLFISLDYKMGSVCARVDLAESNGVLIATYDIPLRTECGESGINCTWSQTRSLTHTENLALLPGRKHVRVTVDGRSVADQSIVVD
ncbi:MAG: hypothetical protein IPH83_20645, partial [Gammaproteobacteria bacterium]|nr:hypothetical protein [Gammaproteobacteria bacterium]